MRFFYLKKNHNVVGQSLTTRVPIDKLALARLAAPVAAKISEGKGEEAFMVLRDALPSLGAAMPVADRLRYLSLSVSLSLCIHTHTHTHTHSLTHTLTHIYI